jgi:NADH dehydrogenase [ubiquinone] 1 alpha subcomplex assembly factor 6
MLTKCARNSSLFLNGLKLSSNYLNSKCLYSKNDSKQQSTGFSYCVNSVKENDFESYLALLTTPQEIIQPAFVVKAFNIELQAIGRSAREPKISEIKLQFWKDQIDKIYSENKELVSNSGEPVSKQLLKIIERHKIKKLWFNRLIDSRRMFFKSHFKTIDDLEKCADLGNTFYILFDCLNLKNVDCDHAANHLAKAQLLCVIARNIFKKPTQAAYYLPIDILTKHKISQQDLFNFSERILRPKAQNFKDLTFDLCSRANEHIKCARKLKDKIPKNARRVLLSSSIGSEIFLKNIEKYDFDLMNPKMKSDFRTSFLFNLMLAKYRNFY